ncbi:MAG TPA: S9 family peptidase [Chthonomonadaceae bacterium]|nr:S9 family peptidase [Chthonomonadaceae bacterium]
MQPQVREGWTPERSMTLKPVGAARVSPDGTRAAFPVTTFAMGDEQSDQVTQIWLADTDGRGARQVTFGEKSSDNARWSPDGSMLAFTSKREEKSRLYVMRLAGGEPEPLTDGKSDAGDYRWSPDGTRLAVIIQDAPTEDEEARKKAKDDWSWKEEAQKYNRLYLVPLEKDADDKREPRLLTKADRQVGFFDWSPDGREIVFDHTEGPSADIWLTSQLAIVDVESAEVRPLIEGPGASFRPHYAPDGQTVAFARATDPPRWALRSVLAVVPAAGGEERRLGTSFDETPALIGWSPDGGSVLFQESYRTTTRLYRASVASDGVETLYTGGANADYNLNARRTWVGFARQTTERPSEAFATPLADLAPAQISRVNDGLCGVPLGKTETIRWTGAAGQEIEGLLTFPPGYQAGSRVPLLLVFHGGPSGVFTETFPGVPSHYPIASFAERGFAVLRPNPRGSSGYGGDFRVANFKDWGGRDFEDLMRGVDRVIEKGIADESRMGVMGWSYGGFMTSWVITQTNRFKAASIGAAVTNLASFNGTADIPSFVPDYFGGEFWDDPQTYIGHSPVFQAKGVTTPALIQHGDADVRVPISQGYEYFNALRRQGVETRMIVFPRQPHGITEPKMLLKAMQTNLEWFCSKLL